MAAQINNRLGIALMILAVFIFGTQDAISRYLSAEYNVPMVVMIRYWFFAVFVMIFVSYRKGSLRAAAQTEQPLLQIGRGLLLAAEICVMLLAFVLLGLIESLAAFTAYPLIVAALAGPVLGEHIGWRRWVAILLGFCGVVIILQPGMRVFSPYAIIPLLSAAMFALYALMTRYAARRDDAMTSFFWTGVVGAVGMTFYGVFYWEPLRAEHWGWMALLCVLGTAGHYFLIKCFEVGEQGAVQPFAYLQLVFGSFYGLMIFGEELRWTTLMGAAIVVAAGIYTILREAAQRP